MTTLERTLRLRMLQHATSVEAFTAALAHLDPASVTLEDLQTRGVQVNSYMSEETARSLWKNGKTKVQLGRLAAGATCSTELLEEISTNDKRPGVLEAVAANKNSSTRTLVRVYYNTSGGRYMKTYDGDSLRDGITRRIQEEAWDPGLLEWQEDHGVVTLAMTAHQDAPDEYLINVSRSYAGVDVVVERDDLFDRPLLLEHLLNMAPGRDVRFSVVVHPQLMEQDESTIEKVLAAPGALESLSFREDLTNQQYERLTQEAKRLAQGERVEALRGLRLWERLSRHDGCPTDLLLDCPVTSTTIKALMRCVEAEAPEAITWEYVATLVGDMEGRSVREVLEGALVLQR